jgi:DNA-binding response OmpR family regulator
LIASGRLGSNDLGLIESARIDGILIKPFSVSELLDAVRMVAKQKPSP